MKNAQFLILSVSLFLTSSGISQEEREPIITPGATLQQIATGFSFTEGPAVDKDGNVFFTDQPNDQIIKWTPGQGVEVYMKESGRSNGLYFDHEGRLLACADLHNELWRIDGDKNIEKLVTDFEGKKLNGPNDLWVDPDGGIYFTDPFYKRPYWEREAKEIEEERVYYLAPGSDQPMIVADDLIKPNGIIGDETGKILFVADIGDKKTYRYEIQHDGTLAKRTLYAEMGSDGMTLDHLGNLYLTGQGVTVFNSKGELIEQIEVPERWTANVTFGGPEQRTLFITAMGSVYTLEMNVKGTR